MSYFYSENQWGENYIDQLNRSDFIAMKSADHFDRYLDTNFWEDDTLYIVIGSDSGLLIPYILGKSPGKASKVVLVEPDEIYGLVNEQYGELLEKWNSNNSHFTVRLYSQSTWQNEVFDGTEKKWLLGGAISKVESRASRNDYIQKYTSLSREVNEAVQSRHVSLMLQHGNDAFTKNQIDNAADNICSLKRSESFGRDKTAVVLGGSPSLDLHLDWIIENREKLFIVAVSRLCAKLQQLNLKPDVVVSIDPKELSYDNSKHGLLWDDVPLIHNYHVVPRILQEWRGPSFFLGRQLPWHLDDDQQFNENIQSTGPTVSHAAVLVCSQLGFTTILMSGIDFCYSETVRTHEKDSHEFLIQRLPSLCDAQLETYSGRIAGTTLLFQRCAYSMEEMGQVINQFTHVLFNLSEEAAKCPSIPLLNIRDVILPASKPDFKDLIQGTNSVDIEQHLSDLSHEVTEANIAFRSISKRCKQALQLVDKAYDRKSNSNRDFYIQKLNKLENKLEKESGKYLKAIKHNKLLELSMITRPREFKDMTNAELRQWGYDYYKVIDIGADKMSKRLLKLQKRISLRQYEAAPSRDIAQLIRRWEQDNTPGRVLRVDSFRNEQLNQSDSELIDSATRAFHKSIHAEKTAIKDHWEAHNDDISESLKSLIFLFNNGKSTELENLHSNLGGTAWPYAALREFTAGLIAELNNRNRDASGHYQMVIDHCSEELTNDSVTLESMQRIIEESLVRMTQNNITLSNYEEALSTMGTLCEMLPQYIPSFAKLLKLCGKAEFAIELLEIYLDNYPANNTARILLEDINTAQMASSAAETRNVTTGQIPANHGKPRNPDLAA